MTRSEVVETEIYYKQGRKKRISYFCHDSRRCAYSINDCYHNYLEEIGFLKIQVAGYYDKAYQHILSIFLSSPPISLRLLHNDKKLSGGGKSIEVTDALKIAYNISQPARGYLNGVNREKISDVCSLENPKVWPIVWQLMHAEPLIEVVTDDPLVLHWRKSSSSRFIRSSFHCLS
jgi:hypothetical protein